MENNTKEIGEVINLIGLVLMVLCLNNLEKLGNKSYYWGLGLVGAMFINVAGAVLSRM